MDESRESKSSVERCSGVGIVTLRGLGYVLEREPAISILREFSLDVISQSFPSYPAAIGTRLGGSDPGTPR